MRADWMLKIWIKEDCSMKKLSGILNCGLFGRNSALLCAIVAFVLTGFFAASCAKSEIAQEESIANAAQSAAAGEEQDTPAGDDQGNSDDPNPGDPSDPSSQPDQPIVPDDPYPHIPIESLDMVMVNCNADSDDAIPRAQSRASVGGEEPDELAPDFVPVCDDEDTRTYLNESQKIFWNQGDKVKIYYADGASNYTTSLIKHGDTQFSTFDALVDKNKDYYYAFYPFDVTATMTNIAGTGAFEVEIPAEQDGKFENCHLAVGKASAANPSFSFYNIASYMKITVNSLTATAITLQATNDEDILVGTVVAPFTDAAGTVGTLTVKEGTGSSSVRVNLASGRTTATTVYIALVPGVNFSKGFRLRYEYDANGDDKDDDPHPGYAYVKRDGRTVARRTILNVKTLDDRIIEDYFVKTTGSCSDADVAGAGNSWGNALNATGLADLLSQPVNGSGSQINDDAFDKAWRLDGATIHMAGGSYTLSNVKMACTDYDHPFKVNIKGGYPNIDSGTSTSASRDTTTNRTTFAGDGSTRILTLGNQTSLQMDKVWITGGRSAANGDCGVGLLVAPNSTSLASAHLTACGFKDNVCGHTNANGGAATVTGDNAWARFDGCHFYSNGTGNEQSAGVIYVWSSNRLAELHINGCTFVNNWSGVWGGAVGCSAGKVYINQEDNTLPTTFTTNYLTKTGDTVRGGAIYGAAGSITARNCDFIGNYLPSGDNVGEGGAIALTGTMTASFDNIRCAPHPSITRNMGRNAAYLCLITESGYSVRFENSSFTSGQVSNVGGVFCVGKACSLQFVSCSFTGNHSSYCGGVGHINKAAASIDFSSCTFTGNYNTGSGGGGVLSMENGTATFTTCTFTANYQESTSAAGGGVFWLGYVKNTTTSTNLTVKGCNFRANDGGNKALTQTKGNAANNQANGGGILYAKFGNVTFTSSDETASGTRTTISGSSSASAGGAILAAKGDNALTINLSYTDISGCSAASENFGGAIYTDAPMSLTSCSVNSNSAKSGGAILMTGSAATLTMTDTNLQNNTSTQHAAGVRIEGGLPYGSGTAVSVTRGTFSGNSTSGYGAVFNFNESNAASSVQATFDSVTFSNNLTTQRGGVFHFNASATNRTVTCMDCTFQGNQQTSTTSGHGGGVVNLGGGTLNLNGCDFISNESKSIPASNYEGGGAIVTLGSAELHLNINSSSANHRPVFRQNVAAGYGGAIAHTNDNANTTISIANTKFSNNQSAYSGGALYHKNTKALSMNKVGFVQNKVTGTYETLDGEHAGDAICYLGSSLTMEGSMSSNYIDGQTSTVPIHCPNVTSLTFTNHEFKDNETSLRNGCMICLTDTSVVRSFTITNSSIHDNKAPHGGAIYTVAKYTAPSFTVSGTSFTRNEATASGYSGKGGAIWWTCSTWNNSDGTPELYCSGCTFDANKAGKAGSAIYLEKGRIQLRSSCQVINNTFSCPDNTWISQNDHAGGAIMMDSVNSKIDINGATISGNHSDGFGGAICLYGGRMFLTNVVFNNNYSYQRGGAIGQISADGLLLLHRCSFLGNSTHGWGDALHINGGKTVLVNTTIYDGTDARSHATINGAPNLMMVNSTVVGNNSNPTLRVESNKNGLLVNSIIINDGSGVSLYGNGNYNWHAKGNYNILGTMSHKDGVTNYYTAQMYDQTGITSDKLGSWSWDDAGYFTWNGKVNNVATATPAVNTSSSTNFTYDAMQNGFALSLTINDGMKLTWNTTNIGSLVRSTWCAAYNTDQRNTGDRTTAGKNYPGAYCPQ